MNGTQRRNDERSQVEHACSSAHAHLKIQLRCLKNTLRREDSKLRHAFVGSHVECNQSLKRQKIHVASE